MQVTIYNRDSGRREIKQLKKTIVTVGRLVCSEENEPEYSGNEDNIQTRPDIELASPLVSPEHLILKQQSSGWQVESKGLNPTRLNDEVLQVNQSYAVCVDDRLSIGEIVLEFSQQEPISETLILKPDEAQLMEIEREIHGQLLERMDIRRYPELTILNKEKSRKTLADELQQLIEIKLSQLTLLEKESLTRIAVYRRISSMIISGGTPHKQSGFYAIDRNDPFSSDFSQTLSKILREIGIHLQPNTLDVDFQQLDDQFQRVYEMYTLDFSVGLRKYLIAGIIEQDIRDLVYGCGPLQDLLNIESISEIMVVSRDQVFIEKSGIIENSRRAFFSDEALHAVIEKIVSPLGRRIDRSSPLVDARLTDGSRVNAIIPPLAIKGPCLTIRKFSKTPLQVDDLISFGALTEQMNLFLRICVERRKNMIVSGGTGSGKTTLLNCLSQHIPAKERIITIEDTAELQLKQSHVVTLESRPANMEGKGSITIQDLVKNALRMRPDRIIVGECRGAEALDMLQAMNTGHDGSMTTGHANSPVDMMLRIETMVLMGIDIPISAVREQIKAALDIVVQLNRGADGTRRVTHIAEVCEIDEQTGQLRVQDIFVYRPHENRKGCGNYLFTGYIPTFIDELMENHQAGLDVFF